MQVIHPLEESFTATEESRHLVDDHFIHEAGIEILLADLGAAGERDVLTARGAPRLDERGLDAVRDKVERRVAVHRERRSRVMREHEHRVMKRWVVSPPTAPRIFGIP